MHAIGVLDTVGRNRRGEIRAIGRMVNVCSASSCVLGVATFIAVRISVGASRIMRGIHLVFIGLWRVRLGSLCLMFGVTVEDNTGKRPHASRIKTKSPSAICGATELVSASLDQHGICFAMALRLLVSTL